MKGRPGMSTGRPFEERRFLWYPRRVSNPDLAIISRLP